MGGLSPLCSGCPPAESLPPADPFAIRTPPWITVATTLAHMEQDVTQAELAGGGWVQLVFHDVCDGCAADGDSVTLPQFTALLDWLQPRAERGTIVDTVAEAMQIAS